MPEAVAGVENEAAGAQRAGKRVVDAPNAALGPLFGVGESPSVRLRRLRMPARPCKRLPGGGGIAQGDNSPGKGCAVTRVLSSYRLKRKEDFFSTLGKFWRQLCCFAEVFGKQQRKPRPLG